MAPDHDPPSLPTSPAPKRTKAGSGQSEENTNLSSVASLQSFMAAPQTAPVPLQVKRLSDKGKIPTRGSAFAAGYDLYASKATVIPARGQATVPTDISISVPAGTYGRVAPRSGLAAKHGLQTGAGVIDADYRGHVMVILFNHSEKDFEIQEGDRCAQLVLERIVTPEVVEVEELEASVRGAGGFGSTGGFGVAADKAK